MCNIDAVAALTLAAQIATIAAIGLLAAAVLLSTNFLTSGGSPALLVTALVFVGVAIVSLGIAVSQMSACGSCGDTWGLLLASLIALIAALSGTAVFIAAGIAPSAVPVAGSVLVGIIVASLIVQAFAFGTIDNLLTALLPCTDATADTPGLIGAVRDVGRGFAIAVVVGLVIVGGSSRSSGGGRGDDDP